MRQKIITLVLALSFFIPQLTWIGAPSADEYDEGKGCYRELLRLRGKAPDESWRGCISFFDRYREDNPAGGKVMASLFSSGRLRQEHYELRGDRADLEGSIKDFNELVRKFPDSSLADDALYRIGCMRQDALGQDDRAVKAFRHVLDRYPDGDMAVGARARLSKLQPEPAAQATEEPPVDVAGTDAKPELAPGSRVAARDDDAGVSGETRSEGGIEERDLSAVPQESGFAASDDVVADAFDRATLRDVVVRPGELATDVEIVLDKGVAHSVEFTEMGRRTGSPPELDIVLLHTKPARDLRREMLLESDYVDSYEVKRLILSSGIKVSFTLKPSAGYQVSKTASGIMVRFGPPNVATAVPAQPVERPAGRSAAALSDFRIVIDPGHGGEEEGAVGPDGTLEKDVTLAAAKRLAGELRERLGAKVYLTRTTDKTLTLDQRTEFAVKKRADLFISIHANASRDRGASGIETYYLDNATDEAAARLAKLENRSAGKKLGEVEHIISTMLQTHDAAESMDLARGVQARLTKKLGRSHGGIRDRGVRSALFYVLVGAKCPAILVETAFISNPKEEKLLKDERYQSSVAGAITDGVKDYLKLREKALVSL